MNADVQIPPFIDTHVHWWNPVASWMRMASPEIAADLNMGDIRPMLAGAYAASDYRRDTTGYPVQKIVWVMANMDATGLGREWEYVHETDGSDDLLGALVGGVDPRLSPADRRGALAVLAHDDRFRGVRVIGELDYESADADDYMRMLADGGYVFDHMGQHPTMADAARLADRHPDVTWVLEHCGWPQYPDDGDYMAAWRAGIVEIAKAPTMHCKISGIAMATHTLEAKAQQGIFDHCVEQFGSDRVMFGSNFPVDRNYGSYPQLMAMYGSLTSSLDDEAREKFFRTNAERVYSL